MRPGRQPASTWHHRLFHLIESPADPWPRWLAAVAAAVACWQAALCVGRWLSQL